MSKPLRVLVLEDSALDAEVGIRELRRAGFAPEWKRVETKAAFLAELDTLPDLILSDYSLPRYDGFRAVQLLRERGLDIPFILISGTLGEDAAVEAMKLGATDYLLKDRIARLGSAVERALEEKRLRDERRQAEEEKLLSEAVKTQATILNALPAHLALLDAQGVIVAVNEAWRQFATANVLQGPAFTIGQNYLEVCERSSGDCSEEAQTVVSGLRRILRGESTEFVLEYPCHSPEEKRWFRLMASPLNGG